MYKLYLIPKDCTEIFICLGTEKNPASILDLKHSAQIFNEIRDIIYKEDKPSLLFSLDSLIERKSPEVIQFNNIEAIKEKLSNSSNKGFNILTVGNDKKPASQQDLEDVSEQLNGIDPVIVSHHNLKIFYS